MPTLVIDTEQAALIKVAVEMLQGALTARTERANPGKIITDSLALQSNKLETVMAELDQPEPPSWPELHAAIRSKAINLALILSINAKGPTTNEAWEELRRIAVAPGFPRGTAS